MNLWTMFLTLALPSLAIAGPRILIIGDSLTEGYGVAKEASYPSLLEEKIRQSGRKSAVVINAGSSGATSAFGVRTLRFQLKHKKPDLIVLALGANDALRGVKPEKTKENLGQILKMAQKAQIKTVLIGMLAPPNYGIKFPQEFKAIFEDLAKEFKVPLIPFLLEGVAGEPHFNLPDGIHPNEKGYVKVANHVWKTLKEYVP